MVNLTKDDLKRFGENSSMGNQLKFEKNGIWYKTDYTGYEGLTEYTVSEFLKASTLKPEEYVPYKTEEIRYEDTVFRGCSSKDFLRPDRQIITLERLYKNQRGESLYQRIWHTSDDPKRRLVSLVDIVESITGLDGFGEYMAKLMTIDALFLNEDRHFHNIAVLLTNRGGYELCPIFDQGAGLLADTTLDYPMDAELQRLYDKVKAKTFSRSFDEQLDAAEALFGDTLHFSVTKKQVVTLLQKDDHYPSDVKNRVQEILYHQMEKYGYLFH